MGSFDLRLCIIVLINMAKSQIEGISWVLKTWIDLFYFLLILAGFSFVSIEVDLARLARFTFSFRTLRMRLLFGNRPLFAAVSFMASLIFSQPLFWLVYPVLLVLSFYPTSRLVDHALRLLQAVIPINQAYDVCISAVVEVTNEPYPQQDETSSETEDLEANRGAQQG